MSEVKFKLKPVEKKPPRRYKKGSKYDPILDEFLDGEEKLVNVTVEGKDANYLRTQLNKRIDVRDLKDEVRTSVVNNLLYLERLN